MSITIRKGSEIEVYHVQNGQDDFCRMFKAIRPLKYDLEHCAGFAQCEKSGDIQVRFSRSHTNEIVNDGGDLHLVDIWNVMEFEDCDTLQACYKLLKRMRNEMKLKEAA